MHDCQKAGTKLSAFFVSLRRLTDKKAEEVPLLRQYVSTICSYSLTMPHSPHAPYSVIFNQFRIGFTRVHSCTKNRKSYLF